jgi:hypothetical protein
LGAAAIGPISTPAGTSATVVGAPAAFKRCSWLPTET